MNSKIFASVALLAALFVAANARADIVTIYGAGYGANNYDTYMELAGSSEWALVGAVDFNKEKAPYKNAFAITNVADPTLTQQAGYTMNSWNGMGSGYTHTLHGTGYDMGLEFSHNSANQFGITTPEGYINAFYLNVGFHANEASTSGAYNITFYGAGGEALQTFNNVAIGFAGFIFDEGYSLTGFEITTVGNKNTGYSVIVVPGDGTPAVPEPATLAIIGLGLAGLGLAKARRRK